MRTTTACLRKRKLPPIQLENSPTAESDAADHLEPSESTLRTNATDVSDYTFLQNTYGIPRDQRVMMELKAAVQQM